MAGGIVGWPKGTVIRSGANCATALCDIREWDLIDDKAFLFSPPAGDGEHHGVPSWFKEIDWDACVVIEMGSGQRDVLNHADLPKGEGNG